VKKAALAKKLRSKIFGCEDKGIASGEKQITGFRTINLKGKRKCV